MTSRARCRRCGRPGFTGRCCCQTGLWLVLRLRCTCGRNLADVTHEDFNADLTRDHLQVTPRPNVRQRDYRPSDWWRAATPGRIEGVDFDVFDRTYTWQCKCGARPTRRHDRIGAYYWFQHEVGGNGLVVATVGRDM